MLPTVLATTTNYVDDEIVKCDLWSPNGDDTWMIIWLFPELDSCRQNYFEKVI